MDWVPIVFVTFKLLVLGTGMFFAIKWHYDRGNKNRAQDKSAVLRISGTVCRGLCASAVGLGARYFFCWRNIRFGFDLSVMVKDMLDLLELLITRKPKSKKVNHLISD